MGEYRVHIDFFETPLADLRGAAARDPIVIFDTILAQGGRFSTFDINGVMAKPISMLFAKQYLKCDGKEGYPYTQCAATPLGLAWREGRVTECKDCLGEGYTTVMLNRRNALAKNCAACDSKGYRIQPDGEG